MRSKALAAQRVVMGGRLDGPDDRRPVLIDEQQVAIILRLLEKFTAGDSDERLVAGLNAIIGDRRDFEEAVIVWVDLFAVLVDTVEGRYGPTGRGAMKKADVKGVVTYLLKTGRFKIPQLPDYLQPVVIDVLADFTVDAVVQLQNAHRSWVTSPAPGVTPAEVWHRVKGFVRAVLRVLLTPFAWIGSRVYLALRYPVRVSPGLRRALDAIGRDALIASDRTPLDIKFELILWLGNNRDAMVAGVQLVGLVTDQIEVFTDLDSGEKKEYARRVIFAVLQDAGYSPSSALLDAKLEVVVDAAIEGVVHLFNKHKTFTHKKPSYERSGPEADIATAPPPLSSARARPAPPRARRPV